MSKVWILLLLTHSCTGSHVYVKGYATEAECHRALSAAQAVSDDVQGQCGSAEAILETTKMEGQQP